MREEVGWGAGGGRLVAVVGAAESAAALCRRYDEISWRFKMSFILGPACSGSHMHSHNAAFNVQQFGLKRWFAYNNDHGYQLPKQLLVQVRHTSAALPLSPPILRGSMRPPLPPQLLPPRPPPRPLLMARHWWVGSPWRCVGCVLMRPLAPPLCPAVPLPCRGGGAGRAHRRTDHIARLTTSPD